MGGSFSGSGVQGLTSLWTFAEICQQDRMIGVTKWDDNYELLGTECGQEEEMLGLAEIRM